MLSSDSHWSSVPRELFVGSRLPYPRAVPSWKPYGVKTLYRTTARGTPIRVDRDYDENATLVEERVVAFRARSFAEAIRFAEKEAREYARLSYTNPYGQSVRTKYLRSCDVFVLDDSSSGRGEVFSRVELVSARLSDDAVVDRLLGHEESARRSQKRRKFEIG